MPASRQNTFSLYLAKAAPASFDDLLTETAREMLKNGAVTRSAVDNFGDGAALYIFPGQPNVPRWVTLLRPVFNIPSNVISISPSAIVVFKKSGSTFALTFSHAHTYLDDTKTEADFGLKVAINAVSDEKLRSVERSNIGAAIRDFAQAAGQRDLREFGFDDALDLIRKVSGRAENSDFANMVSGSRALRFSKRIEIEEVPNAALDALKFFESKAYKKTGFQIIDFLSPVLDPVVQTSLDEHLVKAVRVGSDDFEIAIPAILPEAVGSFRFEHARMNKFHPDLSLELYRNGLGDQLTELTLDDLKTHTVAAYADDDDSRPIIHWSVHASLVGSVVMTGERYALNEGYWYRVGKAFKDSAERRFVELCKPSDMKFRPLKIIVADSAKKGKKRKAAYQSEESYNEEIAKESGYLLLDQRLVRIDDVPGPGIEACDLLDIDGRRFIHVKKSSRQSSVLSHFFKQGGNSAQMMRKYEAFKARMIDIVRREYGASKAQELTKALAKPWTVEFQIADFPRQGGKFDIPFFSKLTLREESRNIEAMGFDVGIRFIKLTKVKNTVSKSMKSS